MEIVLYRGAQQHIASWNHVSPLARRTATNESLHFRLIKAGPSASERLTDSSEKGRGAVIQHCQMLPSKRLSNMLSEGHAWM